jgi:hypothetical protein
MLKTTLAITTATLLMLTTGCSSSNDPKEIAIELCELSKKGDITGIKAYASEPLKTQLTQIETMINMAKNSEEGKKMFTEQIEKFANIKCQETTKITKNEDGSFRVNNPDIKQFYTLKMVDGSWKMFQ